MRTIHSIGLGLLFALAVGCGPAVTPSDPPVTIPDGGGGPVDDGGGSPVDSPADDGSSVTPPPPPVEVDPGTLSVATWNLQEFPKHADTITEVARLVDSLALDLVGIQEITEPEPFEALAEALPDHEMVVSFDSRTFTRVGFLYRPDRITVGEVSRLFSSDRYAFPRSPLYAQLTVHDETGAAVFDFAFVVVHLKAMPDEESRQRRISAVTQLDAWIRERTLTEPDVVVVGDYNDELTDTRAENVFLPFLDAPDTYRMLTYETEVAGAYSYIPYRAFLDHILVTTDAMAEYGAGTTEVLTVDVGMRTYRDVISDHRPVVARFDLPVVAAP